VVRVEAWFAMTAALPSVPPFFREAVMSVARNVWLPVFVFDVGGPSEAADHGVDTQLRG
jgi:hypothetical protein